VDFLARERPLVIGDLARAFGRLDGAAAEHGADAGFLERVDRRVGHLGVAQDVAPVHDGGGAVADLVERADQVAEVHVARR
jgi:hypothetical protein